MPHTRISKSEIITKNISNTLCNPLHALSCMFKNRHRKLRKMQFKNVQRCTPKMYELGCVRNKKREPSNKPCQLFLQPFKRYLDNANCQLYKFMNAKLHDLPPSIKRDRNVAPIQTTSSHQRLDNITKTTKINDTCSVRERTTCPGRLRLVEVFAAVPFGLSCFRSWWPLERWGASRLFKPFAYKRPQRHPCTARVLEVGIQWHGCKCNRKKIHMF